MTNAIEMLRVHYTSNFRQTSYIQVNYSRSETGNLGNMPIIILPAMCKEKGSPFGAADVCERYGLAYASLSMAVYYYIRGDTKPRILYIVVD